MARNARRTYARDARGRFASTNSGGAPKPRRGAPKATGGTLKARAGLARSKGKLAGTDPADRSLRGTLSRRSQKGAVTRAKAALKEAKKGSRVRLKVGPKRGVIRKGGKRKAATSAIPAGPATKKVQQRIRGARPQGVLSKAVKVRRNPDAGKKLEEAKARQKQRYNEAATSAKRVKPTDTLQFPGGGIKGPSGAVLKAYTWQWQWTSVQNREGDEVAKRVSNWEGAVQSAASGRSVVHQFVISRNGRQSVVSAEGALKELGFMGQEAKRFGGLKSSLKTYARLKMEQAVLQRQMDVVERVRRETRSPRITVRPAPKEPWSKPGEVEVRIGQLSIIQQPGMKNGVVDKDGQVRGLGRTILLKRFQDEAVRRITGRRPMVISADLEDVNKRIEKQQKKIDSTI